jgi:L-malate glycosyltransferase
MARIIYFSRDYTSHDWRFLDVLTRSEHQVYYLRLERGQWCFEDRPLPSGVESISWEGGEKPFSQGELPGLITDLGRVTAIVKPDLIHAGPIQSAALLVALSGFRPLVSMSWGYDLLRDAELDALSRWATRYALRRSDLMIGDCDIVRQKAILFGMLNERVVTFPWGIDLEHFRPVEKKDLNSQFTLISTRNWEPIYGVDVIANAFVRVVCECPKLRLVMLGSGSMDVQLRKIFREAGVSDRVNFVGQVSYADLPDYYRSADVYLSASHSDGTSISLLEAMACGCPVLVSDIPGNREWIQPGENGWLFPDGDVEVLADTILKLVKQRQRLKEMGTSARKITEQRADWKLNSQTLLAAYHQVLTETKN